MNDLATPTQKIGNDGATAGRPIEEEAASARMLHKQEASKKASCSQSMQQQSLGQESRNTPMGAAWRGMVEVRHV